MTKWQKDKSWSDRFIPEVKSLLGQHLIANAPIEYDQKQCTDLVVLHLGPMSIAVRIRHHDQIHYAGQFTIRSSRPSGNKTELAKIIEGWGNYFFYAFADSTEQHLQYWWLCDLNVFRLWFSKQLYRLPAGKMPGEKLSNRDGSSDFRVFHFADLPSNFVLASAS